MKNGKGKQHGPYKKIGMHVLSQISFLLVNRLKQARRRVLMEKLLTSVSCKGRVFAALRLMLTEFVSAPRHSRHSVGEFTCFIK